MSGVPSSAIAASRSFLGPIGSPSFLEIRIRQIRERLGRYLVLGEGRGMPA